MPGSYADVAWGPAGFVAIGSPTATGSASAWRSPDGLAWESSIVTAALSGFCPSRVAGGANGYIAIGSDCGSPPRPVIVWSADGRSWVRAPRQSSLSGEGSGSGVVAGGPGWIAFGTFTPSGSTASGTAVWTSRDGLAWRRTSFLQPLPPYVPDCGNPFDHAAMNDIARLGPGYVAVGVSTCGNDIWGAAWSSPDGATWHSVRFSPTTNARFWSLLAVATHDGRLVAAALGPWVDYLPAVVSAVPAR